MFAKLFMLGGPGSGKSTIARAIESFLEKQSWRCERINDYPLLQDMVKEDYDRPRSERWLRWIDENDKRKGFDVLNLQAFDAVLPRLECVTEMRFAQHQRMSSLPYMAVLEFSRNDYERALAQFRPAFLQGAHFIYLQTALDTCKQRIHQRALHPRTDDDYDVSDYIFQAYYNHDNGEDLEKFLKAYSAYTNEAKVLFFNNNQDLAGDSSFGQILPEIQTFVEQNVLATGLLTGSRF